MYNNLTTLNDDRCEETARDRENDQISSYLLSRFNVGNVSSATSDLGIFPSISDNKFGVDAPPRPGDTAKSSKLLYSRPIATMPYMGAGNTSIVNPDLDSALTRGMLSTTKKEYNPATLRSSTYRPMPMIKGISDEIQNVEHIIPTYWNYGGLDTRGQVRNIGACNRGN